MLNLVQIGLLRITNPKWKNLENIKYSQWNNFQVPIIFLTTNRLWRNLIKGLNFLEQVPNNYLEFVVCFFLSTLPVVQA